MISIMKVQIFNTVDNNNFGGGLPSAESYGTMTTEGQIKRQD